MENLFTKQLYPTDEDEKWKFRSKGEVLVPRDRDVDKISKLILSLLQHENMEGNNVDEEINKLIHAIYNKKPDCVKSISWVKTLKFDLVKGSIYKIKKYFLENNYLKDIRGGSMIIDRLNKDEVVRVLNEENLSETNIIYSGGGNFFLAVPKGLGGKLCKKFEERFQELTLTVMNAFETMETSLYDFAFEYKTISRKVNDKLLERKKVKIYSPILNKDKLNNLRELGIEDKNIFSCNEKKVCQLCDIRDAQYILTEGGRKLCLCPSCIRKHKYGEKKSKFISEYSKTIKEVNKINLEPIGSLNELGDEIAVIYGDGNNMGSIVMNIKNVFEMMYFSDKLDSITKHAVYESINEVMGNKAKFEVIALGGDDIFIIVPAEHSFEICSKIIDKFDNYFKNEGEKSQITMSIGVVISKNDTPIASLFNIAQDRLKEAKKITRNDNLNEGSLDIVELLGGIHINASNNREFPMSNTRFKQILKEFRNSKLGRTQLHKISYAQKTMLEEEFNLFYYYQESKRSKNDPSIDQLIKNIYKDDKKNQRSNPYKINWDDLILICKRA